MMKKTRIANKIAEDAMNRLDELAVLCYYDTEFRPEVWSIDSKRVFDKQMYGQLIVKECAWLVRQETLKNIIEHDNEYLENQWRMQQHNDPTSYTGEVLLEEKIKKHFGINDL